MKKKAFTLIETMIAIGIGVLIALLVLSKLSSTRSQALEGEALLMQNRINGMYLNWTALGGTHSDSTDDSAQLCYNILRVLSSSANGSNAEFGENTNYASDGNSEFFPNASSCRFKFPLNECSIAENGIDWSDFHIDFIPQAENRGRFTVSQK